MHLQSIELSGYRSFADTATFPCSSEITTFVGPNGLGKSRILEAVIWALDLPNPENKGEIIFEGTSDRSPMMSAEVSLTISGVFRSGGPLKIIRTHSRETGKSIFTIEENSYHSGELPDWFPQVASKFHLITDISSFQALLVHPPKGQIILLDEVDAPMNSDEVHEYCEDLDELVQNNQLVIITHSKLTMSLASVMCGITMEEWGVSVPLAMRMAPENP